MGFAVVEPKSGLVDTAVLVLKHLVYECLMDPIVLGKSGNVSYRTNTSLIATGAIVYTDE